MTHDFQTPSRLCELLVENSLGLMCIHDVSGLILAVNPAVPVSLGYPPGSGPGANLRDFLAPAVRHFFDDYLQRIGREGKDSGLMRLQACDGSERIWMYRNVLHTTEDARTVVLGHALDITDRVRAERALKEAKAELRRMNDELADRVAARTAELEEANRRLRAEMEEREAVEEELIRRRNLESLGVLAGGIAHDLNNFLTVVQGNAALAKTRAEAGLPVEKLLEEIAEACESGTFLASQLLTFAKGGIPVRRPASVAKLLQDAVSLARAGDPVGIHLDIAADLWPAEIDTGQMGQVLHNVLLNARQAMPTGGIVEVAAVNTTVQEPGASAMPYVRIAIRDYGSGIPADVLPRIFDPYFTTKSGATGLGLTSAYSIVQKHGGAISVDSQPGYGTLVTIALPAAQASMGEHPPEIAARRGGPWKLLVMDDEEGIRKLLEAVLGSLGHEVTSTQDGAEAIALYESARASGRGYDAVLLDLTVKGGMGGIDAAARLKETDPSARLIVSSGYSDSPVLSDFRKYGFDEMVPKPWTPAQVVEIFEKVLAAGRARESR